VQRRKKEELTKKEEGKGNNKTFEKLGCVCSGERAGRKSERGECMLGMKLPQSSSPGPLDFGKSGQDMKRAIREV
jgi:hypothetical protein